MRTLWLILAVCLLGGFWHWREQPVTRLPGVLAPDVPRQDTVKKSALQFQHGDYRITTLASFELQARVLLKKNYYLDAGADLAPVDLALGWGPMSANEVLEYFDFSQSNRFYYWRTEHFPIPRKEVETHSANMHMIPATQSVANRLKAVRSGNIVNFRGYLVEARKDSGWHWRSSLTRDDTGDGACELVWVESLEVY